MKKLRTETRAEINFLGFFGPKRKQKKREKLISKLNKKKTRIQHRIELWKEDGKK